MTSSEPQDHTTAEVSDETDSSEPAVSTTPEPDPPGWLAVSRGVALFLGFFCLLNLAGELFHPGFDANIWWVDLRPLPMQAVRAILALAGLLLLVFGAHPIDHPVVRILTRSCVMFLLGATVWNTVTFYRLLKAGVITTQFTVPFSVHVSCALFVVLAGTISESAARKLPHRDVFLIYLTIGLCAVGFPIAQVFCYGKTDYRRESDLIVVFGCRVFADGEPSEALRYRVLKAVELYDQGLSPQILMSGGPGDGDIDEPTAMKALAIQQGVPEEAILVDIEGLNTDSTAHNTRTLIADEPGKRVMAVSDFYHLPRIKLSYRRYGIDVATVPSSPAETRRLLPQLVRETVALWLYYLRPTGQ